MAYENLVDIINTFFFNQLIGNGIFALSIIIITVVSRKPIRQKA